MIRNESLQLASSIAMAPGFEVKPTPLLASLLDQSFGAIPYTENFVAEAQEVTRNNEHTFILNEQSGRLAEIIRESMYTIRDYGIPLAKKVAEATHGGDSLKSVTERALRAVSFRYINLDQPFFDSSIYPTALRNDNFTYEGIDLAKLDSLTFRYPTKEEVLAFIDTQHPELLEILKDPECSLTYVAETFFTTSDMKTVFTAKNTVFDFTQVKVADIHLLMKAYVLFAKMYASEDPAPWLTGGSLDVYREMVNLIYNGLIAYLLRLKQMVATYRQIGFSVNPTKSPRLVTEGVPRLEVEATVYYTNAILESVLSKDNTLTDLLIGTYYGALLNNKVPSYTEMLNNQDEANGYYRQYLSSFVNRTVTESRQRFMTNGLEAIAAFITSVPELKERLEKVRTDTSETFLTWLNERFGMTLENAFASLGELVGNDVITDAPPGEERPDSYLTAVLNTRLVPTFLGALGCDLAAEIVESTYTDQVCGDDVPNQRTRIRIGVIDALAKRLLSKAD